MNVSNVTEAINASEDLLEADNESTELDGNRSDANLVCIGYLRTEENVSQVPSGGNGSFVAPEDALLGNISANDSDVGFDENLSDWTLVESHRTDENTSAMLNASNGSLVAFVYGRLRIDLSLSMDSASRDMLTASKELRHLLRLGISQGLPGILPSQVEILNIGLVPTGQLRRLAIAAQRFALLADFRIRPDSDAGIDEAELLSDTLLQGSATQQIASYFAAADSWQGVLDETPLEEVEISQTTVSSARVVLAPEGSEVTLAPLTLRATTTLSSTTASRTTTVSTTQTMETNDTGANESVTTSQWTVVAGTECNTSVLTLIPLAMVCLAGLAVGVAIRSSVELLADPARALCDVPCLRRRLPALTAGRRLGHAPLLGRQPVVPWLPPLFHWTCRPKQRLEIGREAQEGDASPLAVRAAYWQVCQHGQLLVLQPMSSHRAKAEDGPALMLVAAAWNQPARLQLRLSEK
eukprot:s537_g11.t4